MSFEYQEEGIAFLRSHLRAYLGDEAGLGKSRQLTLAARGETLIVAPAMVIDSGVWTGELAKWGGPSSTAQSSYHGLVAKVGNRLPRDGNGDPTGQVREDLDQRWGTVIFDEAHHLKGRKTAWTRAAERIVKKADRVYFASGTPIANWAPELFTVLRMLHPGDRRFSSYWRWINSWFVVGANRFTQYAVSGDLLRCMDNYGLPRAECFDRPAHDPCDHWREFYAENLGELFLQRRRDDVLKDLPELTHQVWECPMGPEQRRVYKQLKKEYTAYVAETGQTHFAWSDAAKYVKLVQCTTGLPVLDPAARKGSSKLDALREILPGRDHPVLLLCYYKDTAAALFRLCDELGLSCEGLGANSTKLQRQRTVQRFQAGKLDVLIGSIEVVSEGLTLTRADTTILVERHWRPSRNEQAIRRVHRIGQERPVTVIELRVPDSVDDGITKLLEGKNDNQARALSPARIAEFA